MRPQKTTTSELLGAIERLRTASARELCGALGVSQQTVSRLLGEVGGQVCRMGRTRGARYARVRSIDGLGTKAPVYRVSTAGAVEEVGTLHLLTGARHWLERRSGGFTSFEGLPPFIADMAPQGYLGRAFGERHPDLELPRRTQDWSNDHLLVAVGRRGEDLVGDLILGTESLDRHLASAYVVSSPADYPARARETGASEPGSSAGGEHPKFLAFDGQQHLIVKFAAAGASPEAARWRDLLACEALALEVISEAGVSAAEARTVDVEGMRFLEVVRFDRVGARGRVGMLSLGAWDDAFLGLGGTWSATAERMVAKRALSEEAARQVRWLDTFGALIANSDRHRGNLTFLADETDGTILRPAPAYDMLPMHFAPRATGVDAPPFTPPPPRAATLDVWASAARAAHAFWSRAARDPRISEGFREIAAACGEAVEFEQARAATMLPA